MGVGPAELRIATDPLPSGPGTVKFGTVSLARKLVVDVAGHDRAAGDVETYPLFAGSGTAMLIATACTPAGRVPAAPRIVRVDDAAVTAPRVSKIRAEPTGTNRPPSSEVSPSK